MKNSSDNSLHIKRILVFVIGLYGLMQVLFMIHYGGFKRSIPVESRQANGVVQIDSIKYPTPYRLQQARIVYHITGPIDYLLLATGEENENIVGALLRLSMSVLMCVFVWRIDMDNPFQRSDFKRAYLLYLLFVSAVLLDWIKALYACYWVDTLFQNNKYHAYYFHYHENPSGYLLYLMVVIFTAVIYLYGKAIRNQEELELTI